MRYLMNSAVIPEPDVYRYELVTAAEARRWLAAGRWESRIGYAETARYIGRTLGVRCPLSRAITQMDPGDAALVVRLNYRPQDPRMKRQQPQFAAEDWEIGLLRRIE